jgi:signal transduction histidine kinase/DNA-binding response OmpR family regulator
VDASGEVADLKNYINAMIGNLRQTTERNKEQDWLKTNLAKFSRMMQGQRDLSTVSQMLLSELAPLVGAQQGVIYVAAETRQGPRLKQLAAYADAARDDELPREYAFTQGLVGQCAQERKALVIEDIPAKSVRIASGLVEVAPRNLIVFPVLFEGEVKAVIELASLKEFAAPHIRFLEQLADIIGVVVNNIEVTMRTERLLAQSQQLATEQQTQQRELQKTNEELAQKAQLLAAQNAEVERKNQEIEQARRALEEKAAELALTSRYKSEFLANMSHELRTPLNSILVLGQQLAENNDKNLSERQVEYASTIRAAGTDLLNLISDILDLSKIESGTVTVECEEFELTSLRRTLERTFAHESEKGVLEFGTTLAPRLGRSINTDPKRLLQVLKNLLSNAFKFTEQGSVRLSVDVAEEGWSPGHPVLDNAEDVIAFSVSDTGIGIPPEKQKIIFEAFQQADAGTARKHGGTGLGLAISRELAQLLGGELKLESTPGRGSTFTLYLPAAYAGPAVPLDPNASHSLKDVYRGVLMPAARPQDVLDDRDGIEAGDSVLLVVQGDRATTARVVAAARDAGFKAVAAGRGADLLALARQYRPEVISIDVSLPDMHGWTLLSRLKSDPELRHVPVQVCGTDDVRVEARRRGAKSLVAKPAGPMDLRKDLEALLRYARQAERRLLVYQPMEGDGPEAGDGELVELVGGTGVDKTAVASVDAALERLGGEAFDCLLIDASGRPDAARDLLKRAEGADLLDLPVVVYVPGDGGGLEEPHSGGDETARLARIAPTLDNALETTSLFLHRSIADLSDVQRERLGRARVPNPLAGRTILVVDDDSRNIFALSSLLESHGVRVVTSSSGAEAVRMAGDIDDLSLVLLDIMMPAMDGYETMRRLRANGLRQPIIALTAKAMAGDREKCLEAGASDYIAKPVDSEQLLTLLGVWLLR